MPARGGIHSGLGFHEGDIVVPSREVIYLRPSPDFIWEDRYAWYSNEIGFIVEIQLNIEETGEILFRILTPYHLGWTDSWSVISAQRDS